MRTTDRPVFTGRPVAGRPPRSRQGRGRRAPGEHRGLDARRARRRRRLARGGPHPDRRRLAGRAPQPGAAGRPVPRRHHPGRRRGRRGRRPRRAAGRPARPASRWTSTSRRSWRTPLDPAARRTAALLAPLLEREAGRRPLLVTSFDPAALLGLRERVPAPAYGLISVDRLPAPARRGDGRRARPGRRRRAPRVVRPEPGRAGPVHRPARDSVAIAHDAGLEVLAWCPEPGRAPGSWPRPASTRCA